MMTHTRWILLLVCWFSWHWAYAEEAPVATSLYVRHGNLQQSMLAARRCYTQWLSDQPASRAVVECGPWLATPPLSGTDAEKFVWRGENLDVAAVAADVRARWTQPQGLVDGQSADFLAGPPDTFAYLTRTIRAAKPVRLTIGMGGGDQLDLWLNGRQIVSANTHLVSGRYGCGECVDGTRVDQVLADLDLREGVNELVVRLTLGSEPSFYFSAAPDPTAWLWKQLRQDFPPQQNPLLSWVPASWFEKDGWFAAQDLESERQLIEQLASECGDEGSLLRAGWDHLNQAGSDQDDLQRLDLCVKASVLATLCGDVTRLRSAVTELSRSYGNACPGVEFAKRLDVYEQELKVQAAQRLDPDNDATRRLMGAIPQMRHEMLVERNPLLRDAEILFVKRYTYNSKHYYDDFQHIHRWGGNLCRLSLADGRVRELAPQLAGGVFDRYDLSFDASRIVFGYRRPQPEGFRIYEVNTDGSNLRQVIPVPDDEEGRIAEYGRTSTGDSFYGLQGYHFWTDDVHPCYLPDGGICFASTRCEHGVLCTASHYLACTNLFRIEPDGSGPRPLSRGALSEFTPTLMEDGRILYNRWEYIYKGIAAVQPLWTMRPDGSANEEFYGDNVTNPGVLWQARQIPGQPNLAVCIGCGHEPLGVGPVLLLDLNKDKRTLEPITNLTPYVKTQGLRGLYQLRNGVWREDIYGPFYADPFPLSDTFLLVSCNSDKRYNDESAYGIYLLDAFGNRVPVYQDPEMSCWQPMLLQPRKAPPILPAVEPETPADEAKATIFMSDVYRGLDGVEPGTIKYLRVVEQVPKPWSAEVDQVRGEDRGADGFGGHLAISWNSHIWVAVLHGIVPVEEDGSACFEVPPNRNLFFQALDKDLMAVQRMRTFVNFAAGEQRSCIGCHEHRTQAPVSRSVLALGKPPAQLSAQPGDVAPRPFYYPSDVQPLLDQYCVRCHDGHDPNAAPDLRGELTTLFSRSYENMLQNGWVHKLQEWDGLDFAMQHAPVAPPYAHASHNSRLVKLLKEGHYDVALSSEEWGKLVTWIDCGAPYYGSYFGRRNLAYQGQPDFRPVPTLASACGIAPKPAEFAPPEPLPAQLLARWPLDDLSSGAVIDASGQQQPARAVNITSCTGPEGQEAAYFSGGSYIQCDGLAVHHAISIAMWVKPDTLGNTWNPLLFCDEGKPGAVHLSILSEGVPNVAINTGDWNWVHRKGRMSLADGKWHHLVLVCDARYGGSVQFYIDGRLVDDLRLSLARQLNLYGFRIGAWNRWEDTPASNFHGGISDVRVYSGMLTEQEIEQIAAVNAGHKSE